MLTFTDIAAAILVAAFITVLVNFRFLMYPLVPSLNPVVRKAAQIKRQHVVHFGLAFEIESDIQLRQRFAQLH